MLFVYFVLILILFSHLRRVLPALDVDLTNASDAKAGER